MEKRLLRPEQIVTLNSYPVHNLQILKIYFRIFQKEQGKIMPPCPVLHKSTGIPLIKGKGKYNSLLNNFLKSHPKAEYFLLDGTHKTTAAALTHSLIPVIVFRNNEDIKEAKKLVGKGEIFSLTVGSTIRENLEDLRKHFFKTMIFQTVAEKTEKMVKTQILPKYMIDVYVKNKK
jgi:hypothetical protein